MITLFFYIFVFVMPIYNSYYTNTISDSDLVVYIFLLCMAGAMNTLAIQGLWKEIDRLERKIK